MLIELQLRPSVNKIKYELLLFPFVGEYNYTHVTDFMDSVAYFVIFWYELNINQTEY